MNASAPGLPLNDRHASPDYAFLLDALKRLANDPRVAGAVAEHEPVKWLRVSEAARLYQISRSQIYFLISRGTIRSCSLCRTHRIRGSRRVLAASLDEYFERNRRDQSSVSNQQFEPCYDHGASPRRELPRRSADQGQRTAFRYYGGKCAVHRNGDHSRRPDEGHVAG